MPQIMHQNAICNILNNQLRQNKFKVSIPERRVLLKFFLIIMTLKLNDPAI